MSVKPKTTQYERQRFEMHPNEAKQIKILRVIEGGYQRTLSKKRVEDIKADLIKRGGSNYPEITIANVNGQLQCVDGQHRLLGHISANVPVPVHIMSMTQSDAIDTFCRDNGKAKPLRRIELIASSRTPAAKTIRSLATDYKATLAQVSNLMIGIKSQVGDLHDHLNGFTDPEIRVATEILSLWSKDKRFVAIDRVADRAKAEKYKDTVQAAFSSTTTLFCLGRIGKDNIKNINRIKDDMKIMLDADWTKKGNSLRGLQGSSFKQRRELLDYIKGSVLLPAYKKK